MSLQSFGSLFFRLAGRPHLLPRRLLGDVPLLGDVDNDGDDDFCVFTGDRFLCDTAHDGGAAEIEIPFADPAGTVPVLGNLDGF